MAAFSQLIGFSFLSIILIFCCLIVLLNSTEIKRQWIAFPENAENTIVSETKVTLNIEKGELSVFVTKPIYVNELFGRNTFDSKLKYEYEIKLIIWNEEMHLENNFPKSIDLNEYSGKEFSLLEFGISDINDFVLKIMVECKEYEIINYYDSYQYRRKKSTGRAKYQLFKLIHISDRLSIFEDFSEYSPPKSVASSSSNAIHQNIEMKQLNWMPDELKQLITMNLFLVAESRAKDVSKNLKFAYVGKFIPMEQNAFGTAHRQQQFLHFILYSNKSNLKIRICRRFGLRCESREYSTQISAIGELIKYSIQLKLEINDVHLNIILELKNNIKEVYELKPHNDFVLTLEMPNFEIKWKPPPSPQPHNDDSNLVSTLTVKHFFIDDLLLFDYNFKHDYTGGGGSIIHHKIIEYCKEEIWDHRTNNWIYDPITKNYKNKRQVEILNKIGETKTKYRLENQIKKHIRIYVRIMTSAKPNAIQKELKPMD